MSERNAPTAPNPFNFENSPEESARSESGWLDEDGYLVEDGEDRGFPVDHRGMPYAPGTGPQAERSPFDYLDPNDYEHEEMARKLKPVDAMTLICTVGCRHYHELLDEEPSETLERKAVHRMCKFFWDDEGDMDLTEKTMYACSAYSPPWWRPDGQVRRVMSWLERHHARGRISPSTANQLSVRIATMAVKALKQLGVDLERID